MVKFKPYSDTLTGRRLVKRTQVASQLAIAEGNADPQSNLNSPHSLYTLKSNMTDGTHKFMKGQVVYNVTLVGLCCPHCGKRLKVLY